MANQQPYRFMVLMEYGAAVTQVVGDTINVTSDGGLRVFLGKKLVGAVRAGQWRGCVLRPVQMPESPLAAPAVDPHADSNTGKLSTRVGSPSDVPPETRGDGER